MRTEEEKRRRILENAQRLFMTYGFSRVSMEEISKSSGVGKATVYQLFDSKQTLMLGAIDHFQAQMDAVIYGILSAPEQSPLEKLQAFLKTVSEKLSHIRPEILQELEFGFPEAFEKIQQARYRIIIQNLTKLLLQGKESGIYDSNMNEVLVAHVVIGAVDHITQAKVLSTMNLPLDELFHSILSTILKGCLSEEYRNQLF